MSEIKLDDARALVEEFEEIVSGKDGVCTWDRRRQLMRSIQDRALETAVEKLKYEGHITHSFPCAITQVRSLKNAQPEPEVDHELCVLLTGTMDHATALREHLRSHGHEDEEALVAAFLALCKITLAATKSP